MVLDSEDLWLVAFTAPWCGHCKRLVPEFASASAELKGKAKLGNVDSTVHQGVAGKYGVNGYPTLKVFLGGAKDGEAVDYEGGRTASDIVAWAEEEFLKNAPAPEVLQATRQDSFEESCVSKQICFVAFLPLLQDSGKDGRLEYIETLKATAEKYKRRPFGYVWVEGTAQLDFEGTFGVGGGGYPALIAVNAKKMRFSSLKGQFSASGLSEFINKLVAGRGTVPVNGDKLPSLVVTESWDGNDFVPDAYEEEFDLADLMDDDDDEDVSLGASKDEL
jgi:protein disulfide-isomerase A6